MNITDRVPAGGIGGIGGGGVGGVDLTTPEKPSSHVVLFVAVCFK